MGDKANKPGDEPQIVAPEDVAPNPPAAPEAPAPEPEKDKEKWQEPKAPSSRKPSFLKTTLEGLQSDMKAMGAKLDALTAAPKSSTPEPASEPKPQAAAEASPAPAPKPPADADARPAVETPAPGKESARKNRRWI